MMAEFIATIAAGLWAGAAGYISVAEHPSALKVGIAFATEYFRPMSKRTAPLMMLLAAICGATSIYAWYAGAEFTWLLGGIVMLGMFPLTAVLIVPTNLRLLKIDPQEAEVEATQLHERWGRMHALRTVVGSVPFVLFVATLALRG